MNMTETGTYAAMELSVERPELVSCAKCTAIHLETVHLDNPPRESTQPIYLDNAPRQST